MPIRISYALADLVGEIWYWSSPRLRDVLAHNLLLLRTHRRAGSAETLAGHAASSGPARRICRNFGRVVAEFLYLARRGPAALDRLIDYESFEQVKKYAHPPGAVFATAHLGNWELAGAVLPALGINLAAIVYDDPDPRVARMFRRAREARGIKVVPVKSGSRELLAAVRDTSLGVVADRDFSGRGMTTTFLGRKSRVPFAYAGLAASRGIPVVFGICVKLKDGKYHLILEDPLYGSAEDPESGRRIAEKCIRLIEKYVEKYPEQWYLFERIGGE
jgi:lauroyl/myristoyl acyltransferase